MVVGSNFTRNTVLLFWLLAFDLLLHDLIVVTYDLFTSTGCLLLTHLSLAITDASNRSFPSSPASVQILFLFLSCPLKIYCYAPSSFHLSATRSAKSPCC